MPPSSCSPREGVSPDGHARYYWLLLAERIASQERQRIKRSEAVGQVSAAMQFGTYKTSPSQAN